MESNKTRARVAKRILEAYAIVAKITYKDSLKYLLCGLMHLCDEEHDLGGFDAILSTAKFMHETNRRAA
jgi:hypothetical protein